MELKFGALEVTGDFSLINIKELGFDRDFMIRPDHRVLFGTVNGIDLQLVNIARILLRASISVPEVTCHFLGDTDLASAVANITFSAAQFSLDLKTEPNRSVLRLIPKT